ncbi:hypothetical protein EYR40_007177 [Pleurotus pulmonarius]|nr:hypothetical protein EYR36_003542 [Pleurotus pulmonarius]KAF4600071.1 hypothetical protein EYR40_007177 [Pleurotus pulmonarius]
MPIATTHPFTTTYSRASDIPTHIWDSLKSNEWHTNTVLPHLIKRRAEEQEQHAVRHGEFWITCCTPGSPSSVDLVLSCTDGPVKKYPIFIASIHPYARLTPDFLDERIYILAEALAKVVSPSRVYSVYAAEPISLQFMHAWAERTGIQPEPTPYYASKVSHCTKDTLIEPPIRQAHHRSRQGTSECRLAQSPDLEDLVKLCFGFSVESPPFQHSPQSAYREAKALLERRQAWVLAVRSPSGGVHLASIVAVTRNTENVATITKVYTLPEYRGHGYAETLVRHVTKEYLKTKQVVMLYVGHENPAANVYRRVGYVGLGKGSVQVKGVDNWMEVGFDQNKVVLGHW